MIYAKLFYLDQQYHLFDVDKTLEFTKGNYDEDAGCNLHKKKEDEWMEGFADTFERLSLESTKTTDTAQLRTHLQIYNEVYTSLWNEVTSKRHRRMNLGCSIKKQQYFGRLANKLKHPFLRPGEEPLVIMGSAHIRATMKGSRATPVTLIQRTVQNSAIVVYSPEPRTSIICATCGALTKSCCSHGPEGYPVPIRGMVFCPGNRLCKSSSLQLKNRDGNGAQGIVIRALFKPRIYNTGDGLNLTKRRGRKFISHGDKVQERKNRQLAITRKSPPETMVTNTVCANDDMENLTPNLPRVSLDSTDGEKNVCRPSKRARVSRS